MSNITSKYSRSTIFVFGLVLVTILVSVLLYLELIAVLYVLATLALVALLLVVAFSDLEGVDRDELAGFTSDKK